MIRLFSMLLVAGLTSACAGSPPPAAPVAKRLGLALDGRPITAERLATLAGGHGARPSVVAVFEQWPENPAADDLGGLGASLAAIREAGATPVVTWEPMYYRADGAEVIVQAERVVKGEYDGYIDRFATLLAAQRGTVIVRLMHEFNLGRYHWGVPKDGYDGRAPRVYREMWRHIVGRVRAKAGEAGGDEAAKAILFAFCPNAESVPGPGNAPDAGWNTIAAYYPGEAWVDVVGVDGYNWGDTQTPEKHGWRSSWRGFADILGPAVKELRALAPGKPLYVFETATAPTGGDKAAWLREAAATAKDWKIETLCWFEADKEIDWRLGTGVTPDAVRDFVEALR